MRNLSESFIGTFLSFRFAGAVACVPGAMRFSDDMEVQRRRKSGGPEGRADAPVRRDQGGSGGWQPSSGGGGGAPGGGQPGRLAPRPKFGFGGRAFNLNPALRTAIPGVFLGETLVQACAAIRNLLAT